MAHKKKGPLPNNQTQPNQQNKNAPVASVEDTKVPNIGVNQAQDPKNLSHDQLITLCTNQRSQIRSLKQTIVTLIANLDNLGLEQMNLAKMGKEVMAQTDSNPLFALVPK
jgi:hypothetical protein